MANGPGLTGRWETRSRGFQRYGAAHVGCLPSIHVQVLSAVPACFRCEKQEGDGNDKDEAQPQNAQSKILRPHDTEGRKAIEVVTARLRPDDVFCPEDGNPAEECDETGDAHPDFVHFDHLISHPTGRG
jgi:hypothetical protein